MCVCLYMSSVLIAYCFLVLVSSLILESSWAVITASPSEVTLPGPTCCSPIIGTCCLVQTGIGPVKAVKLLREHRSIEKIVETIQREGKVH